MTTVDLFVQKAQKDGCDASAIIQEALSCNGLYNFAELLECKSIASAGKDAELLSIFAYGTWQDYKRADGLPKLDDVQTKKLKQLTIASLAAQSGELSYSALKDALELDHLRALEDLVLDTIYQGMIDGKIDQRNEKVIIDFAISRDIRDQDLVRIQSVLKEWLSRSEKLIAVIEDKVATARSEIKVEEMRREEFEARVKEIKENIRAVMEAQEAADAARFGAAGGRGRRGPGGGGGGHHHQGQGGGRRGPGFGGMMRGFFN